MIEICSCSTLTTNSRKEARLQFVLKNDETNERENNFRLERHTNKQTITQNTFTLENENERERDRERERERERE